MPKFYNPEMGELAHQLTLSPRRLRLEQLRGIDGLLALIERDRAYPFDFVCYHITQYRKRGSSTECSIPGKALICDLTALAEFISRRANLSVSELQESYETHQELADRLKVSTKTIRRWRNRGLMGLRVVFADGVNRLAFCKNAVDRFVARNSNLVTKGAAFKQLTPEERDRIVCRAREIVAHRPMKLHGAAKLIAEETGRAVETVRYTLRRFEASHDGPSIFGPRATSVLCERYAAMWRCHQAGETPSSIAGAFDCSRKEVEQILCRIQVEQWQQAPPDYISNELFDAPDADAIVLDVPEPVGSQAPLPRTPKGLPAYLASLYLTPLLTAEQERDLFRRYNYLKYKTAKALKLLHPERTTFGQVEAIRGWMSRFESIKQRIIRANLRLVVSIAKRHVGWSPNFYEVISDGNVSLMRAVEKFDYARGNRFSTYATWAITKNFARSIPENHYHCRRFVTGQDGVLDSTADQRAVPTSDSDRRQVQELLTAGMRELSEREREILTNHYGLANAGATMTLAQLGRRFGVTKERVRQIEQQAMIRLREVLAPSLADAIAD